MDVLGAAFDETQLASWLIGPSYLPILLESLLVLSEGLQNLHLGTVLILEDSNGLQNSLRNCLALSIDLIRLQSPQKQLQVVFGRIEFR